MYGRVCTGTVPYQCVCKIRNSHNFIKIVTNLQQNITEKEALL